MDEKASPRCAAIVAGLVCLDIFPGLNFIESEAFDRNFIPGRVIEAGPTVMATGGAVSNTGLALARQGVETRLIGKIGQDPIGEIVKGLYLQQGQHLADGLIVDPQLMTGHSFVINPNGQERRFISHSGANNSFRYADIAEEDFSRYGIFHFGYPSAMRDMMIREGEQLELLYRKVKQTGITTSLDTAMVDPSRLSGQTDWRSIFKKTLPFVDLFLPSFEEILYMLNQDRFEMVHSSEELLNSADDTLLHDLSQELLDMGTAIVMIKMGHRGLYLRTASKSRLENMGRAMPANLSAWADLVLIQPSYKVNVKGTTGAGDACIAGFLAALLRDLSPQDSAKAANAVAATCCEEADALSGIQNWEQICRRINQGWETL